MRITIDTKHDSRADIEKAIRLLSSISGGEGSKVSGSIPQIHNIFEEQQSSIGSLGSEQNNHSFANSQPAQNDTSSLMGMFDVGAQQNTQGTSGGIGGISSGISGINNGGISTAQMLPIKTKRDIPPVEFY